MQSVLVLVTTVCIIEVQRPFNGFKNCDPKSVFLDSNLALFAPSLQYCT